MFNLHNTDLKYHRGQYIFVRYGIVFICDPNLKEIQITVEFWQIFKYL